MTGPEPGLVFPSLAAAAAASGVPYAALKAMKADGLPGFETSGRVRLNLVLAAMFARSDSDVAPPAGMKNWREALNKAQAERQQLRLEHERGHLVERAWVASRFQAAASEINAQRTKSEAEDPLLFSAAAGDVSECRGIVRRVWDGIFTVLQTQAKHFSETTDAASPS